MRGKYTLESQLGATVEDFILTYRKALILNNLHNLAFGSIFVPTLKFCCVFTFFITFLAVTKLRHIISHISFVIFLFYTLIILILIVPSAVIMSEIYHNSNKFPMSAKKDFIDCTHSNLSLTRRRLNSLPILKSKVGIFYHMEGRAKLTLFDDIARGIAFMMVSF